jgi:hypothetical protein
VVDLSLAEDNFEFDVVLRLTQVVGCGGLESPIKAASWAAVIAF